MNKSTTIAWLSKAIGQATRSSKFCVVGSLPVVDPGIEVEGLGAIKFPLKRASEKALIACCQVAPYGKGTETLVNKKVRNTLELDPEKFRLSDQWNSSIISATRQVAEQLGLPVEQLEAKLYKLLVYEKGGFFLPHRDSEKLDRMVASMVVALPNPFEGGELIVRHGTATQRLNFSEAAAGKTPCYAAFYADCEHEVRRIYRGVRLCLAYNLVLKSNRVKRSKTSPAVAVDELTESIRSWITTRPTLPLVFALKHHYTQHGLSLDLLKGADRQLADLVVTAAKKTDCVVYLSQVSRHLSQFADDGSFERGYSRYDREPSRIIEIGETYEDELNGTEWADIDGNKQPWESIAFDPSAIVSELPLDDWKPTSEEFEGYTGNAGNTLDRWYHRSAIVIWPRVHHFDVVASSGAINSIPLFCSMVAIFNKTPKKRLEEARNDCIRFARAIIFVWPNRIRGYRNPETREKSPYDDFSEHLLKLHDRDTIAMFLTKLAECDSLLHLASFVVSACHEFGWNAFAPEMKRLISSQPNEYDQRTISFRDIEWLSAFCCDKTKDSGKLSLARELCVLAAGRFCEPWPERPKYYHTSHYHRETSVSEKALPLLLKALAVSGCDEDLSRVIDFVQKSPDEFNLDDCQVPCLKLLVPWSRKQFGGVPSSLVSWLAAIRHQLQSATAKPPKPPADWTRPADLNCQCQFCARLKAFLSDPANEVGRIPAREDIRQHLINIIGQHQCDVKYVLDRKGNPYSLVLTKTHGSFERAVKRFELDRQHLSALPVTE